MKQGEEVLCLKSEFKDFPFEEGLYKFVAEKINGFEWDTPKGKILLDEYDHLLGFPFYVRQVFKIKNNLNLEWQVLI